MQRRQMPYHTNYLEISAYESLLLRLFTEHLWPVVAPVRCSWQGIGRSLAASSRAVKISLYIILLLPLLTARATARTKVFLPGQIHPGVVPPLFVAKYIASLIYI